MLKVHTRTQQMPALVVAAWCAAHATVRVFNRVLKNAQKLKNVTRFLLPQHFYCSKFLTK
jgi:hypothetical protein